MKQCPKCGNNYPDEMNFCVVDRAQLISIGTPSAREAKTVKLPAEQTAPTPSMQGASGNDLYRRIKEIIVDVLGVDEEDVTPTAHFVDDLEADSLNVTTLVMRIEEALDIEIPDEDAEKMQRIIDVYKYLEDRLQLNPTNKNTQKQFPFNR
jgi:acyl carrier protein